MKRNHLQVLNRQLQQSNLKPSDPTILLPWIYAHRQQRKEEYPQSGENNGKWLIFVPPEEVDEIWDKIKNATLSGLLGDSAKVAPIRYARPDEFTGSLLTVICVYTYDWTDEEDVMRIRHHLRELGITRKISYKSDADTMAGKYYHKGGKRISKYRC